MLGIFGAHLLLLNKQIKRDLLDVVVTNLRRLLGNEHPDVSTRPSERAGADVLHL